ncbi:hypothetical protein J6590_097919 [Homalodisca vitripennis]|nr:hypothetical protein J6590_097919 [Homalodisca vitripennis]
MYIGLPARTGSSSGHPSTEQPGSILFDLVVSWQPNGTDVFPCSSVFCRFEMSDCASCSDPLPSEPLSFAICSSCDIRLHLECADILEKNWNRMADTRRGGWKCKVCIGASKSSKSKETVSQDIITKMQNEFLKKMEDTIKKQFSGFEARYKTRLDDFQTSLQYFSNKIDDYDSVVKELKLTVKSIETSNLSIETQNLNFKRELATIKTQFEELQQYNRNRNLQIERTPEVDGEQMRSIVQKVAGLVGESVEFDNDIQAIHRIPVSEYIE